MGRDLEGIRRYSSDRLNSDTGKLADYDCSKELVRNCVRFNPNPHAERGEEFDGLSRVGRLER
jgi:hypothetical protein